MVYIFLADGFEIVEAMAPYDMLTRAGIGVATVGIGTCQPKSSCGIQVTTDLDGTDFTLPADAEMVVLPGGMPGTNNLRVSAVVTQLLHRQKSVACILQLFCAAPWALDEAGLLDGKKATMYPGMESNMKNGSYTGEAVVVDGKVITARAAGCAVSFGLSLVGALRGEEAAAKVKASIYPNW